MNTELYSKYKGMLAWYVIRENFSASKFEKYNVFSNASFLEDVIELSSQSNSIDEFKSKLDSAIRYHFALRTEYEVILKSWPVGNVEEKIDVAYQIFNNWDRFVDYTWETLTKHQQ